MGLVAAKMARAIRDNNSGTGSDMVRVSPWKAVPAGQASPTPARNMVRVSPWKFAPEDERKKKADPSGLNI